MVAQGKATKPILHRFEFFYVYEKSEVEYVVIEVRPEGCIYSPYLYITLNRQDMQSKFGLHNVMQFSIWKFII